MTSVNSRCLPMMGAGGEGGAIEGSERTRCGFSYLPVIRILLHPIAHNEASLRSCLTQYGKQKIYYILGQALDDIPCTYLYITPRWLELSYVIDAGTGEF